MTEVFFCHGIGSNFAWYSLFVGAARKVLRPNLTTAAIANYLCPAAVAARQDPSKSYF